MSLFGDHRTKSVELVRGFVDPEGNAYRKVVLREPMIEDEIRADAAMAALRYGNVEADQFASTSDTLHTLATICECIVSWEGLPKPELRHLRTLSRQDARRLIAAYHVLEAEEPEKTKGEAEGND